LVLRDLRDPFANLARIKFATKDAQTDNPVPRFTQIKPFAFQQTQMFLRDPEFPTSIPSDLWSVVA
jgi:hypothetical protein